MTLNDFNDHYMDYLTYEIFNNHKFLFQFQEAENKIDTAGDFVANEMQYLLLE